MTTNSPKPIWSCKIGTRENASLAPGCDAPMRRAVAQAFRDVAGVDYEFCFSGWSASLDGWEEAVVENRSPSDEFLAATRLQTAAPDLLAALKSARRYVAESELGAREDELAQIDAAIFRATGDAVQ